MVEVSVIIPTYNRREFLRRALESVYAQEGVSYEVIVVDDGSQDSTSQMIFADFHSVCYWYQDNQGPAAARNRGLELARGRWMAFLDSDDVWKPGKLKAQLEFFEQNPAYLVAQTEEIWIRRGRRVNPMKKHKKYGGRIFEKCLPLCIVSPSAVMMHREVFDEVGMFDESLPACEDYELWLRVASRFEVGLIPTPFTVKYGGHPGQRSQEFAAMDLYRIRALNKVIKSKRLTTDQARAARQMLEKKASIYVKGALKRGKKHIASEIEKMITAPSLPSL